MHESNMPPGRRAFFYLSCGYFDNPEIMRLTNRGIMVHLELITRYVDRAGPGYLTDDDLAEHPKRITNLLIREGFIGEYEGFPGRYYVEDVVFGWRIFKPGPFVQRRAAIPRKLRESVYDRDGHQCLHCGTGENLSLDHIMPWSKGGEDTYENLQTLCRPCNSRKGAKVAA